MGRLTDVSGGFWGNKDGGFKAGGGTSSVKFPTAGSKTQRALCTFFTKDFFCVRCFFYTMISVRMEIELSYH